jgi:photosystem II stability/assembly factor-like uncharacterized protein
VWKWNKLLEEDGIDVVAGGNGLLIATRDRGILLSRDGQTWESQRSDAFGRLEDIVFADARFVAVGACGNIMSSVDGRTWRLHPAEVGMQLNRVAFGLNHFVISGGLSEWSDPSLAGLILQSDPVSGEELIVRTLDPVRQVVPGETFTLSAAASGRPPLHFQWYYGDSPLSGATSSRLTVTAATTNDAGLYFVEVSNAVAQARSEPVDVRVSFRPETQLEVIDGPGLRVAPARLSLEAQTEDPDGTVVSVGFYLDGLLQGTDTTAPFTWESSELSPGTHHWVAEATDNAGMTARSATVSIRVVSSNPLVNWSIVPAAIAGDLTCFTRANDEYLLCVADRLYRSPNPASVEFTHAEERIYPRHLMWGDGTYVVVTTSGMLTRSSDLIAWESIPQSLPRDWYRADGAYGDGRLVIIVARDNTQATFTMVSTSTDLTSWESSNLPSRLNYSAITYHRDRFVVVGDSGSILWSMDGMQWNRTLPATSHDLLAVTHGAEGLVAVGDNGAIVTSPDGALWTEVSSPTSETLNSVAYGGGAFAAVGGQGTILTSPDGFNWTVCDGGDREFWQKVIWAEGRFIALGPPDMMLLSDPIVFIDAIRMNPEGDPTVSFAGAQGPTYHLERSPDLVDWITVASAAGIDGPMELMDHDLPPTGYCYYRVTWTP